MGNIAYNLIAQQAMMDSVSDHKLAPEWELDGILQAHWSVFPRTEI